MIDISIERQLEEECILQSYDLVNKYNSLISKVENRMYNFYFSNLNEEDLNNAISIPLVCSKEDDEYIILRDEIRKIQDEINRIDKDVEKPDIWLRRSVLSRIDVSSLSKEERERLIEQELKTEVDKRIKTRQKLVERIISIREEPLCYIRFLELKRADFSAVKNENARKELENMQKSINNYMQTRNSILDSIKYAELNSSQISSLNVYELKSNE